MVYFVLALSVVLYAGEPSVPARQLADFKADLRWSPDGKRIAYIGTSGRLVVRDAATLEPAAELGEGGYSYLTEFAPGGDWVAAYGGGAEVWNIDSGRRLARLPTVTYPKISPDGRFLVGYVTSKALGVWETSSWKKISEMRSGRGNMGPFAFPPNGKSVVSYELGQEVRKPGDIVPSYPEAKAKEWDIETGKETGRHVGDREPHAVKFSSPDGKYLAEGYSPEYVQYYYSISSGGKSVFGKDQFCAAFPGKNCFSVNSAAFSRGGRYLAAFDNFDLLFGVFEPGSWKALHRWQAVELIPVASGPRPKITAFVFSKDERFLAAAVDHPQGGSSLRVWDLEAGQESEPLWHKDIYQVSTLGFSADGKSLFTAGISGPISIYPVPTEEAPEGMILLLDQLIAGHVKSENQKLLSDVRRLKARREALGAETLVKGEFETAQEFQERRSSAGTNLKSLQAELAEGLRQLEEQSARHLEETAGPIRRELEHQQRRERKVGRPIVINLGSYDADNVAFPAGLSYRGIDRKFTVKVPRADAPRVKTAGLSAELHYRVVLQDGKAARRASRIVVVDPALGQLYFWEESAGETLSSPAAGRPKLPARLTAKVSFTDADGDSVLGAEEKGKVSIVVANEGAGPAFGVVAKLTPAMIAGLSY